MNVLIVEDDPLVGDAVQRALESAQYTAQRVGSAEEGWVALTERPWGLAIVDVGLPGQNGLDFVREARRHGNRLPIIVATARDSIGDRQNAFAAGANDYLPKPFQVPDLIARCRALITRTTPAARTTHHVLGALAVDFQNRVVLTPPLSRSLTEAEWKVLNYFMRHVGELVTRDTLAALLDLEPDHVDGTVQALRAVLESALIIRVVRGLGYRVESR